MISLFELHDDVPILTIEARNIKAFNKLYLRDKSKNKETATKELAFIYYYKYFFSPYNEQAHESEESKANVIKVDIDLPESWVIDADVQEAIDVFDRLQYTKSLRLAEELRGSLDKLKDYLKETDLTETVDSGPRKGSLVHDTDKYMKVMKSIPELVESVTRTKELVSKEMQEKTGRGGRTIGEFEL